jgi:hypothetical protein
VLQFYAMNKLTKITIALAALVCSQFVFTANFAIAQTEPGSSNADPRIASLLKQMDIKYEIDSDGDYKVYVKLDKGRDQVIYINSKTESLNSFEIREIWSFGYTAKENLPADIANKLLLESSSTKLGAWAVVKSKQSNLAIYQAKIDASGDAKKLASAIIVVAQTADDMELSLTGKDDL